MFLLNRFHIQLFVVVMCVIFAQGVMASGAIQGVARDAKTNEPAGGVIVSIADEQNAMTMDDGSFAFNNLNEGLYVLRANFGGFRAKPREIEVRSGKTTEVLVKLDDSIQEIVISVLETK